MTFAITLTDQSDGLNGEGPYSVAVLLDPTTAASGGTSVYTNANSTHPKNNFRAAAELAVQAALNKITIEAISGVDDVN